MRGKIARFSMSALISTIFLTAPVSAQVTAPVQIRPEIKEPLQDANTLVDQGNFNAAMIKVNEAEAVPNKTAAEMKSISQMKTYIGVISSSNFDGQISGFPN